MSSVESVSGSSSSSYLEGEILEEKEEKEAVISYVDSGENGGLVRLELEGAMKSALAHNVQEMMQKVKVQEKCERLEQLIDLSRKEPAYILLAQKVLSYDLERAKAYAARAGTMQAYVELAKLLKDDDARKVLTEAKVKFPAEKLLPIYEEESRRGFPETDQTFSTLSKALLEATHCYYPNGEDVRNLAILRSKFNPNIVKEDLAREHLKEMDRLNTGFYSWNRNVLGWNSTLKDLIAREAEAEFSGVFDLLGSIRNQHTAFLYDYKAVLGDYGTLLELELKHSYLKSEYNKDTARVGELIETYRQKYPDRADGLDWAISRIAEKVAPYDVPFAQKLLAEIVDKEYAIGTLIAIFKAQPSIEKFERLLEKVQKFGEIEDSIKLFRAAAETIGLDRALPLLQRAKLILLNEPFLSNDSERRIKEIMAALFGIGISKITIEERVDIDNLRKILKAETHYHLSGLKETLEVFYKAMAAQEEYCEKNVIALIEAEFATF